MRKTDGNIYTAEVDVLDKGIEAEKQKITDLQAKLASTREEKARAEKIQEAVSYDAETTDDPAARKQLETTEETLVRADKRVHSIEIALTKAGERLNKLRAERAEAIQLAERKKLDEGDMRLRAVMEKCEEHARGFIALRAELRREIQAQEAQARRAGVYEKEYQHALNHALLWIKETVTPSVLAKSKVYAPVLARPMWEYASGSLRHRQPEQQAATEQKKAASQ